MERKSILNDRIQDIIVKKELTPSHFADEIGVQRSSISHILANRNKPSLEIIHKILRKYPDISFGWLMDGVDEEYEKDIQPNDTLVEGVAKRTNSLDFQRRTNLNNNPPQSTVGRNDYRDNISKAMAEKNIGRDIALSMARQNPEKILKRIIMVYTDDTFDTVESNKNS